MEFQDDVTIIFLDYVIIFDDVNPLGHCDVINAPTPLGRTPTLPLISVSENGEVYTPETSCIKGVNRGMQIRRSVPFFVKSVDLPKFLFKSKTTTTSENRGVEVQR